MKTIYILFLLFSIIVTITSCDPQNSYRKIISNQIDSDILVTEYLNKAVYNTYIIKSNSESLIYNSSRTGGPTNTCKFLTGDSLDVKLINNTSLTVTKNLNLEDSWINKSSGNSAKGYMVECRAIINDADIVPK